MLQVARLVFCTQLYIFISNNVQYCNLLTCLRHLVIREEGGGPHCVVEPFIGRFPSFFFQPQFRDLSLRLWLWVCLSFFFGGNFFQSPFKKLTSYLITRRYCCPNQTFAKKKKEKILDWSFVMMDLSKHCNVSKQGAEATLVRGNSALSFFCGVPQQCQKNMCIMKIKDTAVLMGWSKQIYIKSFHFRSREHKCGFHLGLVL